MSERAMNRDAERRIGKARREGLFELDLSDLRLRLLPNSLIQLTQLRSLNLSNNRLTKLPNSLGRLTQLQTLDLRDNMLMTLPSFIGRLPELKSLDLCNNELGDLPTEIVAKGTEAILAYLRCTDEATS